jgi:hypothetical protein
MVRLKGARRRRPGIYGYRTRKHGKRFRTEWGYIGKSTYPDMRDKCHQGMCIHEGHEQKPWYDLTSRQRILIRLPWFMGWDFILLPLEWVVIQILRPRYNVTGNLRNPRRVPLKVQALQRAARDVGRVPVSHTAKGFTLSVLLWSITAIVAIATGGVATIMMMK